MNKQENRVRQSGVNWSRCLLLVGLIGVVMVVLALALTAVPQTQTSLAQGGGAICGAKWDDLDGDGIWDEGVEPGLPGWTIQIMVNGALVTTTTNIDGYYCFDGLADGQYAVQEVNQPGWTQTYPEDPAGGPGIHFVTIIDGQVVNGIDFGNTRGMGAGGIHGAKFYDENANGSWDATEHGLPDWVIELQGPTTTLTTTTDANGNYWFMDIATGTYTVTEQLQEGWQQTFPPSPGNYIVLYVPSQAIEHLDFGNWTQLFGEIHGQKFHDLDGDGVKDAGEMGLAGWTIQLQGNGGLWSTVTDAQGNYWFMGLPPGNYTVTEIQQPPIWNGQQMIQWVQTFPSTGSHQVQLTPSQLIVEDVDFGNWQGGKNDFCMIPWDNHFLNTTSLLTEIYIFNASTTPQKAYTLQLVGPTTFSVLTPLPITLNPYQYGVVQVQVDYPSMFTMPYQFTTFQAVVTNLATGTTFTCQAALWSYSPEWWTSPNVNSGLAGGIPFGFTQNISFTVQNNGSGGGLHIPAGSEATYQVWAMSRGSEITPFVSLNGYPPGVAVTGTIPITPGVTDIPVSIEYTEFVLLGPTDIVLELDVTGDGNPDMMTSYLVYIEPPRLYLPVVIKP
jgi:protocatechuate 3,4-dioxygenase beta subunit